MNNIDRQVALWECNGFRKLKNKKVKKIKAPHAPLVPDRLKGLPKICEFCGSPIAVEVIEKQFICISCWVQFGLPHSVGAIEKFCYPCVKDKQKIKKNCLRGATNG